MKRIPQLLLLLTFPGLIFAQSKSKSSSKGKSIFYDWGTVSFGWHMGTAHVDNLYGMWNGNNSNVGTSKGIDAKFRNPDILFKVENITRVIYWHMELALPFAKAVKIENETNPLFDNLQGKGRFGRMINVPVALGGFVTKRLGFWGGYNYSLFYLAATETRFSKGPGPYNNIENFRAGDVGILKGSGISVHTMLHVGKRNLLRFSLTGTNASNSAGKAKGGAFVSELVYFINFDKRDLSSGMMIRLQNSKVTCKDHPFIARFENQPTVAKATALSIEFCFGIPGTEHRSSRIEKK